MNIVEIVKNCSFFPRLVSPKENELLFEEVSLNELLEAMSLFQKGMIPSPYGWMAKFFLCSLDLLDYDVLQVFKEVKPLGRNIPAFNLTFIALIPKANNPGTFGDFKQISL